MGLASAAVLFSGLFLMSPGFKKATIIFLALGIGLLAFTGQPASAWIAAWNSMTNTIAIMVAMQIIAIPVSMGRYDAAISLWVERRFGSERSLFIFSTLITHVLTSFLMLGAIPLSITLLGSTIESRTRQPKRFLSAAISRGYVLAALWAPGAINLYLVVQATGVAWSSILIPGALMAMLGLGLSYLMETKGDGILREPGSFEASASEGETADGAAIRHVLIAAASIVALVLLLERFGIGAGYTRIMLAGCAVAVVWILLLFDRKRFAAAAKDYWGEGPSESEGHGPVLCRDGNFFRRPGIFRHARCGDARYTGGGFLAGRRRRGDPSSRHHRALPRRPPSFHHHRPLSGRFSPAPACRFLRSPSP